MTGCRFGGAHGDPTFAAEDRLDGLQFAEVTDRC